MLPEQKEWGPLLSHWIRYMSVRANNVAETADSSTGHAAWAWDPDDYEPVTALEALEANTLLTRLLDAERDELMIAALADFDGWQPGLQRPGGRPNILGLLDDWGCWAAFTALWSDHLERTASITAAERAAAIGDAAGAHRHHRAAQAIEPLLPVDALSIAVHMIKSLDIARDGVIRDAIAEGVTDQQIAGIINGRSHLI
ncbi:hypothetical protein ACIA8C_00980 [Nocardia sp. NPDC051321]|uniref:hypothetical protein n=1 Tax=Nocardia sp. NPDC051321 TaxID=3364323 RepID=UPI00379EB468